MTREEVKKMLPALQAYADGKELQWSYKNWHDLGDDDIKNWHDLGDDDIKNITCCSYRVKPNPKYRQFKNKEEFWNEVKKHKPMFWIQDRGGSNTQFQITRVDNDGFYSPSSGEVSFIDAALTYEFMDGMPFGIKEEE